MQIPRSPFILLMAAGSLGLAQAHSSAAVPTEWSFRVVIAEPGTGFSAIGVPAGCYLSGAPVIDEDGSVVTRFVAFTSPRAGLIRYDAASQNTSVIIDDPGIPDPDFPETLVSSDYDTRNGRIALKWDDNAIRIYNAAGVEQYRFNPAGGNLGNYTFAFRPSLTNAGAIGMMATFSGVDTLLTDEFAGPVRTQTKVAEEISPITLLGAGFMNQNRQFGSVVWEGTSNRSIRRLEAGQAPVNFFSTVGNPPYTDVANQVDINDLGQVTFFARRPNPDLPGQNIWELRKGTAAGASVLIASDQDSEFVPTNFINFSARIANNGVIALKAFDGAGSGIFALDETSTHRVLGAGDVMNTVNLGSLPLNLDAGLNHAVGVMTQNEANQIAFIAELANGASAVVIATPVIDTPCPGDFDDNGVVEVADIFSFLNAWFSQFGSCPSNCSADIDGMNGVQVADIFAFLNQWFGQFGTPCP